MDRLGPGVIDFIGRVLHRVRFSGPRLDLSLHNVGPRSARLVSARGPMYGECMARFVSTTVRLAEEDVRALKRARAAGLSASDLIRKGLRVVAARYYSGRRPPSTGLFESTDNKLGDESELFRDLDN